MASDNMKVAALGRPFSLGMLYDARQDKLLPGFRLWDDDTLESKITETPKPSSAFDISASDSIEAKSSLLNVEGSLKISVMSGLLECGGSAKFLKDKKMLKNQSRVTCQCRTTTTFKELSVTNLGAMNTQQMDLIKKGTATHVVTGILYGANAFFVFDSQKLSSCSVQDVHCQMQAVITKIPSFHLEGRIDISLTKEERALTNQFSCKFYGDYLLETNPVTFEDAVQTYIELPEHLGDEGVPVEVWLTPLTHFASESAKLKREISNELVRKVQLAFEDLVEVEMRCNDALSDENAENFPQIRDELSRFIKLCGYYESHLQKTLAKKIPLIRDGKEDESSVEQLLKDRHKSPFSHEQLNKWLDHKERELNVIGSCVNIMEGIKIVHSESELHREVLASEEALCFIFTSLESTDPGLDVMATYLDSGKWESVDVDVWYDSSKVKAQMREKAKDVHDLAKAMKKTSKVGFHVAAIANKKYRGATIYRYKDGNLVTENFSKPNIPLVEMVTDKRALVWYACDLNLDPNTAHRCLALSKGYKKATYGAQQPYPDHPDRFDHQTQVLCREGLTGCHYWEVEWGDGPNDSVYVLAGYKGVARKGKDQWSVFGYNKLSWSFGKRTDERVFKAWHNNLVWISPVPSDGCNRIGVYLDWPAGTLSFYKVSSLKLSHLYTFYTTFTEPLYPGLWAGRNNNYVCICPVW